MSSPPDRIEATISMLRDFHKDCGGCPVEDLCDQSEALVAVARTAEEVVATADAERWDVLLANGGLMIDALREALSRLGGAAGNEAA